MNWNEMLRGYAIRLDERMAKHTSFQVGGPADCLFTARSADEIAFAMEAARQSNVPLTVIGRGTNLLVRDGGIRGLVVKIAGGMEGVSVSGDAVTAQAGAPLRRMAAAALEAGLSGAEFAAGIPGGVGGAVAMNAGAYGGEMARITKSVVALTQEGEVLTLSRDELDFAYRHSALMERNLTVVEACFTLYPDDPAAIRARMDDFAARRSEKQPLDLPSAGSTFKRPPGHFAAKLIDDAGLRGVSVGGAMVSPKHAGFVVNTGGATARDILDLMEKIRGTVWEKFGISLEAEVRVLGED